MWEEFKSSVIGDTSSKIDNIVNKTDNILNTANQGMSQIEWIVKNGKPYFIAFGALVVVKLLSGIAHDFVEIIEKTK